MLYEKSKFGRKYTRLISGSPVLFVTFVLIGLSMFLLLTLTTKLDVISAYSAEVRTVESEIMLSIKVAKSVNILEGPAYIYLDKNKAVFPVYIDHIEKSSGNRNLYFNYEGQKTIQSLSSHSLLIDIPQGKETLLQRIFAKGGKGNG